MPKHWCSTRKTFTIFRDFRKIGNPIDWCNFFCLNFHFYFRWKSFLWKSFHSTTWEAKLTRNPAKFSSLTCNPSVYIKTKFIVWEIVFVNGSNTLVLLLLILSNLETWLMERISNFKRLFLSLFIVWFPLCFFIIALQLSLCFIIIVV